MSWIDSWNEAAVARLVEPLRGRWLASAPSRFEMPESQVADPSTPSLGYPLRMRPAFSIERQVSSRMFGTGTLSATTPHATRRTSDKRKGALYDSDGKKQGRITDACLQPHDSRATSTTVARGGSGNFH